jgi:hypothetical protein
MLDRACPTSFTPKECNIIDDTVALNPFESLYPQPLKYGSFISFYASAAGHECTGRKLSFEKVCRITSEESNGSIILLAVPFETCPQYLMNKLNGNPAHRLVQGRERASHELQRGRFSLLLDVVKCTTDAPRRLDTPNTSILP